MTLVAVSHGCGIALPLAGAPRTFGLVLVLLSLIALVRPPALWRRPHMWGGHPVHPLLLVFAFAAGLLGGEAASLRETRDCRLTLPSTLEAQIEGRFMARVSPGRGAPFRVEGGIPGGCTGTFRVVWPRGEAPPPTGVRIAAPMVWEAKGWPEPGRGEWAGRWTMASAVEPAAGSDDLWGRTLRVRGAIADRVAWLWGRQAPVVEALILARKEHLDSDLRDAFARSGTAHLLAISGFHVGVLAGIFLLLARLLGLTPRQAPVAAALGSWLYVLGIGAPDAAVRAAFILSLAAGARLRGVPPMSLGLLSSAFFVLLLWDPGALGSIGFQLSFAGTLGLVTLRRPLERGMNALRRVLLGREPKSAARTPDGPERWLKDGADGLLAGVSATLPTLPLLAWHFDQISLVGIPVTILVSPLVALAIPGILLALLVSVPIPAWGQFLAGGPALLLEGAAWIVTQSAALPWAAVWVSRPTVALSSGVLVLGALWMAMRPAGHRGAVQGFRLACIAGAAVLLAPVMDGLSPNRALEVHLIDVGQGDATALRLPDGGWILVDAGPATATWDAGARRVVPYLKRHGARRIEALVLTHPHLDHVGGAGAVLEAFSVRGILDSSRPSSSNAQLAILKAGQAQEIPWWRAEAGRRTVRGAVRFELLHPPSLVPRGQDGAESSGALEGTGARFDPNRDSVILLLRFGDGAVLLTGDAYVDAEMRIAPSLPPLTVLKAGHHGSRTSTSAQLLEATRPTLVALSFGDGNRYGHPHPEVLERIAAVGASVVRTDRDGNVRIRIFADGSARVTTSR